LPTLDLHKREGMGEAGFHSLLGAEEGRRDRGEQKKKMWEKEVKDNYFRTLFSLSGETEFVRKIEKWKICRILTVKTGGKERRERTEVTKVIYRSSDWERKRGKGQEERNVLLAYGILPKKEIPLYLENSGKKKGGKEEEGGNLSTLLKKTTSTFPASK